MKMLEAKKLYKWYRSDYPELHCELMIAGSDFGVTLVGKLKDGQENELQVDTWLKDEQEAKNFEALVKEFFNLYTPRDVDVESIKTFSFLIGDNDTITWKQFSDFFAWYKIAYFTNPLKRLVTVEKDLPNG